MTVKLKKNDNGNHLEEVAGKCNNATFSNKVMQNSIQLQHYKENMTID